MDQKTRQILQGLGLVQAVKTPKFSFKNISLNTPGTVGGPGSRDQTLAVKSKKNARKSVFFPLKKKIIIFFAYIF